MTTTSSRCRPLSPSKERAQFWKPYPAYKPSGVEWLGDVPEHWEVKRGRFAMSVNPPAPRLRALKPEDEVSFVPMEAVGVGGGITLGQTRVISEVSSGYTEFQDGDVVVAKITPCFENGKAALARGLLNGAAYGTTELHVLRAGQMMDRSFLFYVAISDTFRKLGESEMYGAGGQKRVPPEFNRNFRLPLPPSIEQRAIAAFLDRETGRVDRLVAKKRELIERLKEKRTALISRTVTRGLPPAAARSAGIPENPPLKPSGLDWLGNIPKHWEIRRLKDVGILKGGAGFPHEEQGLEDEELPFYKVGDLKASWDGRVMTKPEHTISKETARKLRAAIIPPDSVVYAKIGAALLLNRRRITFSDCCIDNNMTAYLPDMCRIRSAWAFYWLSILDFGEFMNPGTVPSFSEGYQAILPVLIPPLPEQVAISEYLDAETAKLDALVGKVEEAVERLQEYRTALVTAAVTGKIDVRSAGTGSGVAQGYELPQPDALLAAEDGGEYSVARHGQTAVQP
jgi:type I restriction enzyme S subunit